MWQDMVNSKPAAAQLGGGDVDALTNRPMQCYGCFGYAHSGALCTAEKCGNDNPNHGACEGGKGGNSKGKKGDKGKGKGNHAKPSEHFYGNGAGHGQRQCSLATWVPPTDSTWT